MAIDVHYEDGQDEAEGHRQYGRYQPHYKQDDQYALPRYVGNAVPDVAHHRRLFLRNRVTGGLDESGQYDRDEAERCDEIVQIPRARPVVHEPGDGRSSHCHRAHARGVQRHSVRQPVLPYELRDDSLARGHHKGEECALHHGGNQEVLPRYYAGVYHNA